MKKLFSIFTALILCSMLCSVYAGNTRVDIKQNQFYINGKITYEGRFWQGHKVEGLLMNSRMVNGIFDDLNPDTRDGFKYPDTGVWDAQRNTDEFIAAMESWRNHGLLAFTLNMQGGNPKGYGEVKWTNAGYKPDGSLRKDYMARLEQVIERADELGMVVILGYFYFGSDQLLENEEAVKNAARNMTEWILKHNYQNVIVEIANECDIYYDHEILKPERVCELINLVQDIRINGRSLMAGVSFSGVVLPTLDVCTESDFILIHGNGSKSPAALRTFIHEVKDLTKELPAKPILINEDDHFDFDAVENNFAVSVSEYVSWGLFDYRLENETFGDGYQTVPTVWGINTERKRSFFNKLKEITAYGQAPETFVNPILSGYHPDPSICRVGDTYYMVNSSFEWWPCMPIHKSKDLVNWELIGYGKVDPAKLPVREGTGNSGGIFAVTIRHHQGVFYLITTMIGGQGNFYITATDPAGQRSDPVWLHSPGIDPSLFWDDDDKCYYVGHGYPAKQRKPGHTSIWVQELDLKQGKLVGPVKHLTEGHSVDASYSEGPHIYKHDGKYVLLISEGGTEFNHSVTQFYSDSIFGPYLPNQINPILSHRHLGSQMHIQSTGHADIVDTPEGEWWMVALGTRNFDGQGYLARETFLVPMKWEYIYGQLGIAVNPGVGQILTRDKRPNLPWSPIAPKPARDEFDKPELNLEWNMLRSPSEQWYTLANSKLTLQVRPQHVREFTNPSLLAQRIRDIRFKASTRMTFKSQKQNEEAGLVLYRDTEDYVTLTRKGNTVVLTSMILGKQETVATQTVKSADLRLYVKADGKNLHFAYQEADGKINEIPVAVPLTAIGDTHGGQFNGPMIGVYASSNGEKSRNKATFEWFEME